MENKEYPKLKGDTVTLKIPEVGEEFTTGEVVDKKTVRVNDFIGMDFYIDANGESMPYPLPDERGNTTVPEGAQRVRLAWCYPDKQTGAKMEHLRGEGWFLGPMHTIPKSEVSKVERDLSRKKLVDVAAVEKAARAKLKAIEDSRAQARPEPPKAKEPEAPKDSASIYPPGLKYQEYIAMARGKGVTQADALKGWKLYKGGKTEVAKPARPGPPTAEE